MYHQVITNISPPSSFLSHAIQKMGRPQYTQFTAQKHLHVIYFIPWQLAYSMNDEVTCKCTHNHVPENFRGHDKTGSFSTDLNIPRQQTNTHFTKRLSEVPKLLV